MQLKYAKKNKKIFENIPNIESKMNKNEKFAKMFKKVLNEIITNKIYKKSSTKKKTIDISWIDDPRLFNKINSDVTNRYRKDIEKIMKNSKFYEYELNISDSRIKYLDKIIKENPKMSTKKIDITNQLKTLYTFRKDYFKIKINDSKSKTSNLRSLDDQIRKLEDEFRDQKASGTFNLTELLFIQKFLDAINNEDIKNKDDAREKLKKC